MMEQALPRIDLDTLHFPDDFEEFRARANSGGSLYGIFRRRVCSAGGFNPHNTPTIPEGGLPKPFKRQRSRSLITRNTGLSDEKYVLLALYDYAESQRNQTEVRRHSTAVTDGRDLRRVVLTNSLNKSLNLKPPDPSVGGSEPEQKKDNNFLSPDICVTQPESRKNSILVPPPSRKNSTCLVVPSPSRSRKNSLVINITPPSRKNSLLSTEFTIETTTNPNLSPTPNLLCPSAFPARKYSLPKVVFTDVDDDDNDDLLMPPPDAVPVHRRRSFTITPTGVKNQGDIIVPTFPGIGAVGMAGGSVSGGGSGSGSVLSGGNSGCLPSFTAPPSIVTPEPCEPLESPTGDIILQVPNIVNKPPLSRASSVGDASDTESGGPGHKTDTSDSATASEGWDDIPCYRVLMLGGPGVGKTALTQQFMTSEYMAAQNTSFDDGIECPVPVLLDGEEYIMEFVDLPYTGNPNIWKDYEVDAYVVVFSITDRRSFQKADDFVYDIRKAGHTEEAVILVANKTDLVRGRLVSEEEARMLADGYGCKFIEVSAILNHKVDDLLVGILKQIRLSLDGPDLEQHVPNTSKECSDDSACLYQARHSMLGKFFKPRLTRSCENLLF